MASVESLVAAALGIHESRVVDSLAFRSIPEWDSLGHVSLMVVLETETGVGVPESAVPRLTDVPTIRRYLTTGSFDGQIPIRDAVDRQGRPEIHRGLAGVYLDETRITRVDPDRGRLEYRGYDVSELARRATFEQTAHLLACSRLPTAPELTEFIEHLILGRALGQSVRSVLAASVNAPPMVALRSAVSAAGEAGGVTTSGSPTALTATAIGLVSSSVVAHDSLRHGRLHVDDQAVSTAEYVLWSMGGDEPSSAAVRALDTVFVVQADHDINASTLAARVAIGAGARIDAALTAAIATFAGSAHAGATEEVGLLLERITHPDRAAAVFESFWRTRRPVPGFGHRVYLGEDPRVGPLRRVAEDLQDAGHDSRPLAIADALVEAMDRYSAYGLAPNVDLYSSVVFRMLGLSPDLFPALFACGRAAGWVAHALEQSANNVLIRPLQWYVGPSSRPLPADLGGGA